MLTLCIETSHEKSIVGIVDKETILFKFELPTSSPSSRYLFPAILEAFDKTSLSPSDLESIVVGVGPGSYTGIRVGVSAVKSLSQVLEIPLVGICSLECFLPPKEGSFVAAIDAKSGGMYSLQGEMKGGNVSYLSPPDRLNNEQWLDVVRKTEMVITPHPQQIKEKYEKELSSLEIQWFEVGPDLQKMASFLQQKVAQETYDQFGEVELIYLRKSQAEEAKGLS
jgi:tRNA threonylcarbamoyladenosine biosynthesis protein TsaB